MNIDITNLDMALFSFYWLDIQSIKKYLDQDKQMHKGVFSDGINIDFPIDLQYKYNPNPKRAIFFPVTKETTIMFSNLQDGWATLFNNIAISLNTKACYIKIMDEKQFAESVNYLIYIEKRQKRVVYTLKDSKWIFYEQGTPLAFEDTNYYTARQKKDRFNKKIILEYCDRLQILEKGVINLNINSAFSYELY